MRVYPDTLEDKWLKQAHGAVPTRPAIMIIDMKGTLVLKKSGYLTVREVREHVTADAKEKRIFDR